MSYRRNTLRWCKNRSCPRVLFTPRGRASRGCNYLTPQPVAAARFDVPNLISTVGLAPAMAQASVILGLADEHLLIPADKAAMSAARSGHWSPGWSAAPTASPGQAWRCCDTTLGSILREFTFGRVRQLDAVASRFLVLSRSDHRWWPASTLGGSWSISTIRSSIFMATASKVPGRGTLGFFVQMHCWTK